MLYTHFFSFRRESKELKSIDLMIHSNFKNKLFKYIIGNIEKIVPEPLSSESDISFDEHGIKVKIFDSMFQFRNNPPDYTCTVGTRIMMLTDKEIEKIEAFSFLI